MDMAVTNGKFQYLTSDEMLTVEGGAGPLAVAATIVAIGAALKVCYEIGTYIGKFCGYIYYR